MTIDEELLISDKAGLSFSAQLKGAAKDHMVFLELLSEHIDEIKVTGTNFFDCLIQIRRVLEQKSLFAICQGSVKNVYPSQMGKSMSLGMRAYKMHLGQQAKLEDLVNIFDPAPINEVSTILEQEAFFLEWLEGFKLKK